MNRTPSHIHDLWQQLYDEMLGIYDEHSIYAIAAQKVAAFTGTKTVTAVAGPQSNYYDVWICTGGSDLTQTRWQGAHDSISALLESGQPEWRVKYGLPPNELIHSDLWQLPADGLLAVPLPIGSVDGDLRRGILCLIDPDLNGILTVHNIADLAANITIYLERAYWRQQANKQEIEFGVVFDISIALTSSLSLQHIFDRLIDPIKYALNVTSVSVGRIEPITGDITFVSTLMGPKFSELPPVRLKKGAGIAGWVAENREPVIINDAYADRRFYSRVDNRSGFHTNSMICIPLMVDDRVIGVLQAINKRDGIFHENDLRLLQAIGSPLAASIENATLHETMLTEKRRIETIFANMSEGMATVNQHGLITNTNEALHSLLRMDADALHGKEATAVMQLHKHNLASLIEDVRSQKDDYLQLRTELIQEGGSTVPVLISAAAIKTEQNKVPEIIFVISDLLQIQEVERMRDDFFHGIIHELRTPLATILMYARLLREGKAREKEKADRFLGVIERESDRLQKMVRQMLRLVKMEAREFDRSPEPIALNPLLEEIVPPLADRASEKGLLFHKRIQSDLPPVMGNRETFYLIFKNLIENAVKFTLSGTVRVTIRNVGDEIVARIQDEGIGIPEQAMPNLFGRYFRAQTAVERGIAGTGLGLYMVKKSVETYNGTIEVSSKEGEGTTFTITFPITRW